MSDKTVIQGTELNQALKTLSQCSAEELQQLNSFSKLQVLLSLPDDIIQILNIWPDKDLQRELTSLFLVILLQSDTTPQHLAIFHHKVIRDRIEQENMPSLRRATDLIFPKLMNKDEWQGLCPPMFYGFTKEAYDQFVTQQ